MLKGINVHYSSNHGFQDDEFLSWMVVIISIEVFICMCVLPVNLVGKRAIVKTRNKDI